MSGTLRLATPADQPAIARLCASAFYEDELYGPLMHPFRKEYPQDYEAYFHRKFASEWYNWDCIWWVVTVPADDATAVKESKGSNPDEEKLVGIAIWEYKGSMATKYGLGAWDPRRLVKPAVEYCQSIQTAMCPNRAANPDPILHNPFPHALPFFKHHWAGPRENSIYLDLLGIDPAYQGRGLGKQLVQWGIEKAKEEGVCASVVSSKAGYGLYQKMGFNDEAGFCQEGGDKGNPLIALEEFAGKRQTGWILFRDP
ncbi:acyl-CoA N-acyltransferase [Aaosphaeria arxii CBS 175.79]|uniref:Acyl-CoA N-acyltransferase n=1 Tax=Aaosphaeria arxii CBS 175.79 TaxID=1450172 RepID=A0A6A5XKZ6_9PLEO|nr:acyl-CoA N-acyltransferase [Aaosphaeria arxii CBS 175.79]KAF2013613.1 acyl-CoA N-acyltransferase [Aaosphaeria arxii CBS 175.79]